MTGKPVRCAMVEAGELEEECKALIKMNNLQDNIELLDFRKTPISL